MMTYVDCSRMRVLAPRSFQHLVNAVGRINLHMITSNIFTLRNFICSAATNGAFTPILKHIYYLDSAPLLCSLTLHSVVSELGDNASRTKRHG